MQVGRSKTGLPTKSEEGGGMSNTGSAQIVCGFDGARERPLFVPRGYSNRCHAIFVVQEHMCIVSAAHSRRGEYAKVERIVQIGTEADPDELVLELVGEYKDGDGDIPTEFQDAVDAALGKAHCYHCRNPHYIAQGQ